MRTRNKEKTIEKILAVSQELFLNQGYDKTTMQDIVDQGLSKGAIYHHFKSKREIFEHIMKRIESNSLNSYITNPNNDALSELQELLISKLIDKERLQLLRKAESLFKDPKVFGELYMINMTQTSLLFEKYIEHGNHDGSMNCNNPKETSELITYFFSVWIGTSLYKVSKEDFLRKLDYFAMMFAYSGIDLISAKFKRELISYYIEISKAD